MLRFFAACLLCVICFSGRVSFASDGEPPWVSCFEDSLDGPWIGPKTVRTPTIPSVNHRLRAYARIEARADRPGDCHNTIRLFVSSRPGAAFEQVFMQKASELGGNADSLRPVSWSPNGRWLLAERGNWFYASDAGALDILLYDAASRKVILPNLRHMFHAALGRYCDILVGSRMSFDASSRVHLKVSNAIDEGDNKSQTDCFHGSEEWMLDPEKGTVRPTIASR